MSSPSLVLDDRYLEHDPGEDHPESADRLRVIHALVAKEFADLPRIEPRPATEDELALVHDPNYIMTVAATAGKPFSRLDMDTGLSARSYETARLAVGGLLEAVDRLLGSSPLPSGERASLPRCPDQSGLRGVRGGPALATPHSVFAFVRPPGHHAEPARGMGFCLFNNVAVAAEYAKEKWALKKVLIVDWDLHHGNGTQRAFYADPAVLFFSSHQYPHYPGTGSFDEVGSGAGEGFTVNAPLPSGFGDADYIALYEGVLRPIALEYRPELILVSAGFDPFIKDPLGGMRVTGAGFGALAAIILDIARQCCSGRVLMTLEGGYNPEGLRDGTRAVLNAMRDQGVPSSGRPASPAADRIIEQIRARHGKYWKSLG